MKKRKKILKTTIAFNIILGLLLVDCKLASEQVNELRYYKDQKTNLCFVENYNSHGTVFTNVPCTEEVEKQIKIQATKER